MTSYRVTLDQEPSAEDLRAVEQGLEAYNRTQTGRDDARRLAIFVRDEAEALARSCGAVLLTSPPSQPGTS